MLMTAKVFFTDLMSMRDAVKYTCGLEDLFSQIETSICSHRELHQEMPKCNHKNLL